jgi:hypothetical protein
VIPTQKLLVEVPVFLIVTEAVAVPPTGMEPEGGVKETIDAPSVVGGGTVTVKASETSLESYFGDTMRPPL